MMRRIRFEYGLLLAAWGLIVVWQIVEHTRVQQSARAALINRAKDISNTAGVVMRSQRRFGNVISRDRLESALSALINPGELSAIALLNDAGEVVASAGGPIDFNTKGLVPTGEYWADRTVTLMNLVDLGTNVSAEAEGSRPTIVLARSEMFPPFGTNRPPPPTPDQLVATNNPPPIEAASATNRAPRGPRGWPRPRGDGDGRPPFGRPFWMSEEEYQSMLQKQGVHSFALVLSNESMRATSRQDLWLRSIICALAGVSVVGLGLARRNLTRSAELEVRLARAAELNTHLKEMNLAAAGLAHETRNPLNIIRGLAQLIAKQEVASTEIRTKSREIVAETDRVTAQLNEFINYSRPREVRRTTVALDAVVAEVTRALTYDLEEKAVRLQVVNGMPAVEADEQSLRQALFNLLINAIQAVEPRGEIQIVARKTNGQEAALEIRDNGPGVSPEHRPEIFKPYFTTHEEGTGLGLAVVRQIVSAHGWDIECLPNEPRGAVFRVSHLKIVPAG